MDSRITDLVQNVMVGGYDREYDRRPVLPPSHLDILLKHLGT
jgi:hypothetical protein